MFDFPSLTLGLFINVSVTFSHCLTVEQGLSGRQHVAPSAHETAQLYVTSYRVDV